MKSILLLISFGFSVATVQAQTAKDSVKQVINAMFSAMRNSDSSALRACFAENAMMQTITRTGSVRTDGVAAFAQQVASLPKDSADERIEFEAVLVDDALATVWTPYKFYYAGKFSHCGVNAFQLVRTNGRWRIQYVIDTRRRVGCNP